VVGTDSCRVSRAPHYLGSLQRLQNFRTPGCHGLWPIFPNRYASFFAPCIEVPQPRRDKSPRFRLFRFRSPLLTESHSFSFPGVTEMFHFTPCRFAGLSIHPAITALQGGWVVPFGNPRINACLRLPVAYRNLLRPSSPPGTKASTVCS
jgi:hypothetical protein